MNTDSIPVANVTGQFGKETHHGRIKVIVKARGLYREVRHEH